MRFKVTYSSGTSHEVELVASVAVLGRDPGCDIVLNDSKCSRRHAVVEQGPLGLSVRDTGSANGVYRNGRRIDAAALEPGDTLRLGDVQLQVLTELGETVVVALDEVAHPATAPAPQATAAPGERAPGAQGPELAPPAGRPRAAGGVTVPVRRSGPRARPLTVVVLALLWTAFVPASAAVIVLVAARAAAGPLAWLGAALAWLALGAAAAAMALGLWRLAPWARHLQIAAATLGLVVCPFTLASATILFYMGRSEVRRSFEAGSPRAAPGAGEAEPTFALSIVAMLVVGFVATAAVWQLLRRV